MTLSGAAAAAANDASVIGAAASLVLAVRERDASMARGQQCAAPSAPAACDRALLHWRVLHDSACALYAILDDEYVMWGARALHGLTARQAYERLRAETLDASAAWHDNRHDPCANSRSLGWSVPSSPIGTPAAGASDTSRLASLARATTLPTGAAPLLEHSARLLWGACALSILVDELGERLRAPTRRARHDVVFCAFDLIALLAEGALVRVPRGVSAAYATRCGERARAVTSHIKGASAMLASMRGGGGGAIALR